MLKDTENTRIMPGEASIVPKDNISVVSLPQMSAALKLHDLYHNMIGIIVLIVMAGFGVRFTARKTGSPADAPCYPDDRICTFDRWSHLRDADIRISCTMCFTLPWLDISIYDPHDCCYDVAGQEFPLPTGITTPKSGLVSPQTTSNVYVISVPNATASAACPQFPVITNAMFVRVLTKLNVSHPALYEKGLVYSKR
jgi:hypothetical protein